MVCCAIYQKIASAKMQDGRRVSMSGKLCAMVVKGTSLFAIYKYIYPHICVNLCLNWDHHQLHSKLVADHIKVMIKALFKLLVGAIQGSTIEKFGYEISYKKALFGKHKAITNLFGCRPPMSSILIRIQPVRGHGQGRGGGSTHETT